MHPRAQPDPTLPPQRAISPSAPLHHTPDESSNIPLSISSPNQPLVTYTTTGMKALEPAATYVPSTHQLSRKSKAINITERNASETGNLISTESGHIPEPSVIAVGALPSTQAEEGPDKGIGTNKKFKSKKEKEQSMTEEEKEAKKKAKEAATALQQEQARQWRLKEEQFLALAQRIPLIPGVQSQTLALAKRLDDLRRVTYPEGIKAPAGIEAPAGPLNAGRVGKGMYSYNREFLLQFRPFCRENPKSTSNLDGLNIERSARENEDGPKPGGRAQGRRTVLTRGSVQEDVGGKVEDNIVPIPSSEVTPPKPRTRSQRQRSKNNVSLDPNASQSPQPLQQQHQKQERVHQALNTTAPLPVFEYGWIPWSVGKKKRTQDENSLEFAERKVKALLNKLAWTNFGSVLDQVVGWSNKFGNNGNGAVLDLVARLVLEQAAGTPLFVEVLAQLSRKMVEKLSADIQDSNVKNAAGEPIVGGHLFRKHLLDRCKEISGRRWSDGRAGLPDTHIQDYKVDEGNRQQPKHFSDEYYAIQRIKREGLNLTRFTGELFKAQMLTERIIHEILNSLLSDINNPDEEGIERLCILLVVVGPTLDTSKARGRISNYFGRLKTMMDNNKVSSRFRFMLLDLIELRARNWGPRTITDSSTTTQVGEQGRKKKEGTASGQQASKTVRQSRRKKSPSRITSENNVPSTL